MSLNTSIPEPIEAGLIWSQASSGTVALTREQVFNLDGHVFYPGDAPAVRIRFTADGASMLMTIEDPDVVLKARRKQS